MNSILSDLEIQKKRYTHYISRALALGLEKPEALVKKMVKKGSTTNSKLIYSEFKKALTRQKKLKAFHTFPRVKRKRVRFYTEKKLVPIMCESKTSLMCLGMFIPSDKGNVCIRCRIK